MVKRWEKKGRKPILQLDDNSKSTTAATSSSGASTSGLRGLIQYEDSDNENGVQDSESHVTSAGETKKIDLEVEDFLKEIDALTEVQDTSEAEAKEEEEEGEEEEEEGGGLPPIQPKENNRTSAQNSSSSEVMANSAPGPSETGQSCAWQQCYDEGSGYTYFWNVETNQVTWECPEEVLENSRAAQSSTLNHVGSNLSKTEPASSNQEGNGCRHLPPKKQPHRTKSKPEVGKIIPITYFDQSTTSDSSEDENFCSGPSQKKRKTSNQPQQFGPKLPHVPTVNSPDTVLQAANGVLSSDDVMTSPSHSNSHVVYGPLLPEAMEMDPADEQMNECDTAAPSSSDQPQKRLTNGLSSPLDLSHPLERDSCDQSNVCESSDSVSESSHRDLTLDVDNLVESGSSPLIQVRNISESVEPDVDSVEVNEDEPSTSSLNYPSVSGCDSEEPDSTCTSRKTESNANHAIGREASVVPQGLKGILQYEESESEPEPEQVSASPAEQSVPVWSLYEAKSNSSIDTNHNFLVPQPVEEPKQSTSDLETLSPQPDPSSVNDLPDGSSAGTSSQHQIHASEDDETAATVSAGQADLTFDSSTSVEQEEPRQSTSSSSIKGGIFQVRSGDNSEVTAHMPTLEGEARQTTSSSSSSVKGFPQPRTFDKRHGFGFNHLESSYSEPKVQNVVRPGISFVRSSEVFELNRLNEEPRGLASEGTSSKSGPADQRPNRLDSRNPDVAGPSSMGRNEDLGDEMDLEDIEKELDLALERKKKSHPCTTHSLEMPSTSRQANLMEEDSALGPMQSTQPGFTGNTIRESLETLSNDLLTKLKLLNAERSHLPLFTLLLIMFETRHTDWLRGALDSQYFAARLQESSNVLRQYEQNSTPTGWTCVWDRHMKKYVYVHNATGTQQHDFPLVSDEASEGDACEELASTSSGSLPASVLVGHSRSSAGQNPMVTSSTAEELFRSVAQNGSLGHVRRGNQFHCRSAIKLTSVLSHPQEAPVPEVMPPPLPPTPPPPASPPPAPPKSPPPPPDSTDFKEEDELLVEMDVEDSNSKESTSDGNPSSSSGLTARPTQKTSLGGGSLHSAACLEQEQMAFYESLGSSIMAETNFTGAGVVISSDAIITKPPQTLGGQTAATAISTSDIPPQKQTQENNYAASAPATLTHPSLDCLQSADLDGLSMDTSVPSPRPSLAPGVSSLSVQSTSSISLAQTETLPSQGTSGLTFGHASGPSGSGLSGASGFGGPSGSGLSGASAFGGPSGSGLSGASAFGGPSGSGLSGASGFGGPSGLCAGGSSTVGPSSLTDNVTAIPGPSHISGEASVLNSTSSKKDKKKTKISSGLSMKKKNMSSLVQKWQKIKKEQLLEEGLAQNERRSADRDDKKNTDQDGKISSTY